MKRAIILFSIYSLIFSSIYAFVWHQRQKSKLPNGFSFFEGIEIEQYNFRYPDWDIWGYRNYAYDVGIMPQGQNHVLFIKSREDEAEKIGEIGLNQTIKADSFWNKRVRFSGNIRLNGTGVTSIYIRPNFCFESRLHPDDLCHGYIKRGATTDWQYAEIVMDIPGNVYSISFGIHSYRAYEILADNLKFEIVDKNTPLLNNERRSYRKDSIYNKPTNLDFEKTNNQ